MNELKTRRDETDRLTLEVTSGLGNLDMERCSLVVLTPSAEPRIICRALSVARRELE